MKPKGWDQFLLDVSHDYDIRGKLKAVFLTRFAYENWRKSDLEVWELAEAASHETYKKQMTQIYGHFSSSNPGGCPELNASSRGPGKFHILRDWFKEIKYSEWQRAQAPVTSEMSLPSTVLPSTPLGQNSPYILRPPIEAQGLAEMKRPGGLLRIKAPAKMGKTTLIKWLLKTQKQEDISSTTCQVYLNLLTAESAMFKNLDKFLRWFVANIGRELGLKPEFDTHWDEDLYGSSTSCKIYMQDYLLAANEAPLILVIDNLDRLFDFPIIAKDFFAMLRNWHEEGKNLSQWQQLRMVIATSTEANIKLDINESPFNVGRQLKLSGFTLKQAKDLVDALQIPEQLYQLADLETLVTLVAGHPYLVQMALTTAQQLAQPLQELLPDADTQGGIFGSHLRHQLALVTEADLTTPLQTVVATNDPQKLTSLASFRLEGMGLVTLVGDECVSSCPLYQQYFKKHL